MKRVLSYPGASEESTINFFLNSKGKTFEITSTSIRRDIKNAVKLIGPKILGFKHDEVGTHSLRSGGTMALDLARVSPLTIMMIGRW